MRCVKWLIVLVFLFLRTPIIEGQADYKFSRIDVENGLSNNEIKTIFKDSRGFMWFGTPSGLNRYDGYDIVRVKQNLSEIIGTANNDITEIQEAIDGKLWLRTAFGYSIYDLNLEQYIYNIQPVVNALCGLDNFTELYIDESKNMWFITTDDVRVYNPTEDKLTVINQGGGEHLSSGVILDIVQCGDEYWALFEDGLIEVIDGATYKVKHQDESLKERLNSVASSKKRLFVDSTKDVWVYNLESDFGLAWYSDGKWEYYSSTGLPANYVSNNIVFSLAEDSQGIIWAGTDHGGISLIDKKERSTQVLTHKEEDLLCIPANSINALYCDDFGIVWLGTYKQGIAFYHENNYRFDSSEMVEGIPYEDINSIVEDDKGNLWIGTNGGGLLYYDRKNNTYKQYRASVSNPNMPSGDVIVDMAYDNDGNLWIGYYLSGMDKFDGKTFTNFQMDPDSPNALTCNNVWALHCDKDGNLWVGTLTGGVMVYNPRTGERINHLTLEGSVYDIIEMSTGEILVGVQSGLYVHNKAINQLIYYERDILSKAQLSRYDINSLKEDNRGLLWIGTRNGLFAFHPKSKALKLFTPDNGLAADLIQDIEEDALGNIWVSGNRGLSCISVSKLQNDVEYSYHINNYDLRDGLQGLHFNKGTGARLSTSEMVFGGLLGFNLFDPEKVVASSDNPRVSFTDLRINNISIKPKVPYNGRVLLTQSIIQTEKIELSDSENYLSLYFVAQDYSSSERTRYYYMLEGFDNDWMEADRANRGITYMNLNPGRYVLHLKAISNDTDPVEYPISLQINITPPFWLSTWAWCIYILLFAGLLLLYQRYTKKKTEAKLEYARDRLDAIQQNQMNDIKLRFFAKISNQFRTPLSLIMPPLEDLLNKTKDSEEKASLWIIHKNAKQLLQLVNQLLDFRNIDENLYSVNKKLVDIGDFIHKQSALFKDSMAQKDIKLTVVTNPRHLFMWLDEDKMTKVLVNILRNAQKYTLEGGRVDVVMKREDGDKLRIVISDNGIGIPEESLNKIFDRFYQVEQKGVIDSTDNSSGLGLYFAKEFVVLHGGEIWAEKTPEGGSSFIIVLPGVENNPSAKITVNNIIEEENSPEEINNSVTNADNEKVMPVFAAAKRKKPTMLIIDDNDDFRLYLSTRLKDKFIVLDAEDGLVGLKIAQWELPDIILTDVQMPNMDGSELSRRIKSDIRTCHIPIVLLTSKSLYDALPADVLSWADGSIIKPFNMEALLSVITNLKEKKEQRIQWFDESITIDPSRITTNSLDADFLKNILDYLTINMSNPKLTDEDLCTELGISNAQLHKKLYALTGKTPLEFIHVIRLKQAVCLLEGNEIGISEIAYEVGFSNHNHFKNIFKEAFGVLPVDYRKEKRLN